VPLNTAMTQIEIPWHWTVVKYMNSIWRHWHVLRQLIMVALILVT